MFWGGTSELKGFHPPLPWKAGHWGVEGGGKKKKGERKKRILYEFLGRERKIQ